MRMTMTLVLDSRLQGEIYCRLSVNKINSVKKNSRTAMGGQGAFLDKILKACKWIIVGEMMAF